MLNIHPFSIYAGLWRSFYDPLYYRHVGQNWKNTGFLYLLLLVTVTTLPVIAALQFTFYGFMKSDGNAMINQFPTMRITQGKVSINQPEPFFIYDRDGQPFFAIDTSGQYRKPQDAEVVVLVTQQEVMIRDGEKVTTVDLSEAEDMVVDSELLREWFSTGVRWFMPLMIPVGISLMFLIRAVQSLFYSVLGILMAKLLNVRIGFPAITQLAMVAITPSVVLGMLVEVLGLPLAYNGLLIFLVAVAYLTFAIKSADQRVSAQP